MRNSIKWAGCSLLVLGVAGCAGDDQGSTAAPSLLATSGLHVNSQRYRDNGAHPATGRSGTASLTVRALMNRNDTTDIEMTTGAFDTTATPPGSITKAQVKLFANDQTLLSTANYNNTTPGYRDVLQTGGVHRHQPIQVQASVRGVDGRRTDVVTTATNAQLRPDLTATNLQNPARTYVNTQVTISATVSEVNGDLGARADCVLLVNGVAADQAQGIWVDAAGNVTCAFTYNFHAVGSYALTVAVNNVTPGDWDTANNTVAGTIEIVAPSEPLNYNANVQDITQAYHSHSTGNYQYYYGTTRQWEDTTDQNGWWQSAQAYTWTSRPLTFPLTSVHASESADGVNVFGFDLTDVPADYTSTSGSPGDYYTQSCAFRMDETQNARVEICRYEQDYYGSHYTQSSVNYYRYAGDVTYQSVGYNTEWYGSNVANTYTYNNVSTSTYGTRLAMGAEHGFDVSVSDGTNTYSAQPRVTMTPYNYNYDQPYSCYDYYNEHYCNEYSNHQNGVIGSAYDSSHE